MNERDKTKNRSPLLRKFKWPRNFKIKFLRRYFPILASHLIFYFSFFLLPSLLYDGHKDLSHAPQKREKKGPHCEKKNLEIFND